MRALGLDLGEKRIGIAVSDGESRLATPVDVYQRTGDRRYDHSAIASMVTEWEAEMLYDLVDARYAEERLTLVTTNKPLAEVQQLSDGRIHSRLVEMCYTVDMDGDDYRMFTQTA